MRITGGVIIRCILIVLLQGLILRRIALGGEHFNYISFLIYPILIFLLPLKISRSVLLIIAFFLGGIIDFFYDSPGVHMSASVFVAFLRPWVLKILEPRGGYPVNSSPTARDFGMSWFMQYAGFLLFAFLFFYFCVEVFNFSHLPEILLKTLASFVISFLTILFYIGIFNPKQ